MLKSKRNRKVSKELAYDKLNRALIDYDYGIIALENGSLSAEELNLIQTKVDVKVYDMVYIRVFPYIYDKERETWLNSSVEISEGQFLFEQASKDLNKCIEVFDIISSNLGFSTALVDKNLNVIKDNIVKRDEQQFERILNK